MITNILLQNFIIVESIDIDISNGLQILSGETGTGKSIVVGAIETVFGSKLFDGILFDENLPAKIEITVSLENEKLVEYLKMLELEFEQEMFISREIMPNFRSKIFLNGRRISQEIASQLKENIVDLHKQKDHQKLCSSKHQLELLDEYGSIGVLRDEFSQMYYEIKKMRNELTELTDQEKREQEKIQLYKYQSEEIENLSLKVDEDEKLQNELNLLEHAEEILENSTCLEQTIYEQDNSVYDTINTFIGRMDKFNSDNIHINNSLRSLRNSLENLEDAVAEIQNIQEYIDLDENRKLEIEERLNEINSIKSKYRKNISEILSYHENIKKKIVDFSSRENYLEEIRNNLEKKYQQIFVKADQLTILRQKAAIKFEKEIISNVSKLAIPEAEIKIKFDKLASQKVFTTRFQDLIDSGQDRIDILFSANKGVKMQPLKQAASGGEFSRMLLAIKKILSKKLEKKTMIFDEIDIGIGGKTAAVVGEYIHRISRSNQVICITHSPQIAAYADNNFVIEKIIKGDKTNVVIDEVKKAERKKEIARMLSGTNSKLALEHAEEILKKSKEISK